MKILFVPSDNNLTSGAFRSMAVLNRILNQELSIETLVVLPTEGLGVNLLNDFGIKYCFINSYNWIVKSDRELTEDQHREMAENQRKNLTAIKEFVDLIKKESIDIVHINTTYSYVAAIAAHICGVPVIWHLREFLEEDQKRKIYDREYGYRLIGQSDKIITISKALYKKYEDIFPREKMQTIYNGIDTDLFYKPAKEIFKNKKTIFICTGAVNYNKGQDSLVHACGRLFKKGYKDFELWLVGYCDERYTGIIQNVAKKYGIQDHIKLLGRRDDVNELVEQADIAFMCSKFEAFGRVTVEAMLAGALMIGANTGGTVEIVEDNKTGLLYQQGNHDDLCEKIKYALDHKEEMKKIAAAGREAMRTSFSARRNAKEIADVYPMVLKSYKPLDTAAVIVTYNRLDMLKKCLQAVLEQNDNDYNVLVVDNASTDNTAAYGKSIQDPRLIYLNTGANLGGAGGFHFGMKEAFFMGARWVWIMDDDVIPDKNALKELHAAKNSISDKKKAYFASCVYGLDGCAMNTPGVDPKSKNGYPFWYNHLDKGMVRLNAATFVSLLINSDAILNCGLPCKDFFIWGDDTEYTKRLYRNYGAAYLVGKSKVVHARTNSKNLTIFNEDNAARIGMYYYMIRNTLIYTREYAGDVAFENKLKLYEQDKQTLKKSDDPYKREKINIINKGVEGYYKYDFESFKNRFNPFYESTPSTTIPSSKIEPPKKRCLCTRIREYYKTYGFVAFCKRALYGKKREGARYKFARFITWLPRKIYWAIKKRPAEHN